MKAWFAIDPCDDKHMDSIGVSQFKDPNHTSFSVSSNGVSFNKDPKHKKTTLDPAPDFTYRRYGAGLFLVAYKYRYSLSEQKYLGILLWNGHFLNGTVHYF